MSRLTYRWWKQHGGLPVIQKRWCILHAQKLFLGRQTRLYIQHPAVASATTLLPNSQYGWKRIWALRSAVSQIRRNTKRCTTALSQLYHILRKHTENMLPKRLLFLPWTVEKTQSIAAHGTISQLFFLGGPASAQTKL